MNKGVVRFVNSGSRRLILVAGSPAPPRPPAHHGIVTASRVPLLPELGLAENGYESESSNTTTLRTLRFDAVDLATYTLSSGKGFGTLTTPPSCSSQRIATLDIKMRL